MKHFFLFVFGLITCCSSAQKHDYVWMGGNYTNFFIDFNVDLKPTIFLSNGQYDFLRTLTFLSDVNGKPMFYSNGCDVRNAHNLVVGNGDSLLHNDYFCDIWHNQNYAHSGGVTLPDFSPDKFVMFSLSEANPLLPQPCGTNRIVYHNIDMSANQGDGLVPNKEQELMAGCFQEPSANKHANGRDWWIVMPDNQLGRFYRWLYTPTGIKGPWIQDIENPTIDGLWYCGWSEFSPDGNRYLIKSCRMGDVIYDFDRCTGMLSNPAFLETFSNTNLSATFSPNGQFLYSLDTNSSILQQFDLNTTHIADTKTVIAKWDGRVDSFFVPAAFGYMQHGPDGKIYIWGGGSSLMHVIDFPNRKGSLCKIRQYAIHLPGTCAGASLYYPNYRLGPIDGSSCDTLNIDNHPVALFRYDLEDTSQLLQVTFTDLSYYEPTSWHWDFGDGATSQDTSPVHTYAAAGSYEVCLIASNAFSADTFCRQVQAGVTGIHELPALPHAQVSPNPFSNEIKVTLPALVGKAPQFRLFDLFGRTVKQVTLGDFETLVGTTELSSGIYFWQLCWGGEATQTGKLIKR